jgi:hypothetical protein
MAKAKAVKSVAPYARRLVGDDYVREQVSHAAARLGEAAGRVSRKRGKAAEDKKLYGNLREAATSIRKASLALRRRKPEPKRRGRKVFLVLLAGGGAAVLLSGRGRAKLLGALPGKSGAPSGDGEATASAAPAESPSADEQRAPAAG